MTAATRTHFREVNLTVPEWLVGVLESRSRATTFDSGYQIGQNYSLRLLFVVTFSFAFGRGTSDSFAWK